jgi:hypothetical protein
MFHNDVFKNILMLIGYIFFTFYFFLLHPFRLSLVLFSSHVVFPCVVMLLFIAFFLATFHMLLRCYFCVCDALILYSHSYIILFVLLHCYFFSCCCTAPFTLPHFPRINVLFFSCYLTTFLLLLHCYFFSRCYIALFMLPNFLRIDVLFFSCYLVTFLSLLHCFSHTIFFFSRYFCYFFHFVTLLHSRCIVVLLTLSLLSCWCCQSLNIKWFNS